MSNTRSTIDDTGHRVEAIGSWDHGLESYDIGDQTKDPKVENVKEFVKQTMHLTLGIQTESVKRIQESGLFNDPNLREKYNSHTEEIVAGEKMAVKNVIHQKSFDAPW